MTQERAKMRFIFVTPHLLIAPVTAAKETLLGLPCCANAFKTIFLHKVCALPPGTLQLI
jgi:hypothetical protein